MRQEEFSPTYLALMLVLPLFGIVSSYYGNRLLLLAAFLIAALTVFSAIGKIKENYIILLIFSVSLTLLMSQSVSSSFLQGGDIHQEYNTFSQVLAAGVWHPDATTIYNSVLSITVFPAVLKIVSGLDGMVIFTTVFPLTFAIAPVLLYKLCRTFLPSAESFLASFFFLAYHSFYIDLISEARQEIAEVLLLLLLLLLCSRKVIGKRAGAVSLLMLTVGIVTAHYSIAYIYLFLLTFWFLIGFAFPRMMSVKVSLSIVALTAAITVLWYAFLTSGIDFANLVHFVLSINLAEFFNPASRPLVVNIALGAGALSGPLHLVSRMTYYLVNAALGLGFLVVLFKRKKDDTEREILPILAFGVFFIGASVVIPNFGFGLNFEREYHIGLLLASPCFVYGIIFLNSKIRWLFSALSYVSLRVPAMHSPKGWRLSAATLLFLFFLFDSGWIWAVSLENPTSVLLDSERIKHSPVGGATFYGHYRSSKDVAAVRWLSPQFGSAVSSLCADYWTRNDVLTSYGGLSRHNAPIPTYFLPDLCDFRKGYVFLSELNTVYGIGIDVGAAAGTKASQSTIESTWLIAQISPELNSDNVIYSNGGTTIYNYPG